MARQNLPPCITNGLLPYKCPNWFHARLAAILSQQVGFDVKALHMALMAHCTGGFNQYSSRWFGRGEASSRGLLGAGGRASQTQHPSSSSVGPFGYACAPLYVSEHVKQRTLGQEPKGRRSILTSHLVHRLPRKQRTRALTRSNLTVCLIQTRLPDSIAKRECSAGSAEGPRSKIQRNVRPANDTSFRKATTGKTTAWNLPDRRF